MRCVLKAIEAVGGQSKLAAAVGVSQPFVSDWIKGKRRVPIGRCAMIERATSGVVTRRDLRPDDWWLIWPELVDPDHPAPQQDSQEVANV